QALAGRAARQPARERSEEAPAGARGELRSRPRPGLRGGDRCLAQGVRGDGGRYRPQSFPRAARPRLARTRALRRRVSRASAQRPMSEAAPRRELEEAAAALRAESPASPYTGRTRYSQLEYEALLANASIGIAFTRERRFFLTNPKFAEMFGYGPDELVGQPGEVVYPGRESYAALGQIAAPTLAAGRQLDVEWEVRRKDGSTFLCRLVAKAIDAANTQSGTVWIVEDITERRRQADEVSRLVREQQAILDNATVGISFVRNRTYQRCNKRLEQMFGYGPGELIGQSTEGIYCTRDEFERDAAWYEEMRHGHAVTAEREYRRKDGSTFWCKLVGKAIEPAQPRAGSIWIYDDVSAEHAARESLEASRDALERAVAQRTAELQEAKARAQHLADHDALTALPNRRLLEDRLRQALALSQRNRKQTAVIFIDLDRFKPINDSLGHAVGDVLLKEVSRRLVRQLREGDTICRIGGDEFVVVLPEVKRS